MLTIVSILSCTHRMLIIMSMTARTLIYDAKDLGIAIKAARKTRRLTQAELARRANVARGALQKLETGRGAVGLLTALRLLHTLSLDLIVETRPGARISIPMDSHVTSAATESHSRSLVPHSATHAPSTRATRR